MRPHALAALVAVALAATACSTPTRLAAVWVPIEPPEGGVRNVLVVGIGRTSPERRLFEDHFAGELAKHGVAATPSYQVLPGLQRLTEAELRGAARSGDHDAVVLTRLLAVDEETRYVPPTTSTMVGYGTGPWGYYGQGWGVTHSPGYIQTTTIVRLETRLYATASEELLWSAQSDTFSPHSVEDTIESATRVVMKRLARDGFLPD